MNKRHPLFITMALAATMQANADAIDKAQARLVAQEVVNIDDTTTDNTPLAPYYIFSRGEGKGYVIVSGDDSTAPIIGYTDSGDFVEGQIPQPLQNMLNSWAEKIKKLQEQNPAKAKNSMTPAKIGRRLALASYKSKWTDVPVLMSTHWHQSYPYNMLAPHRTDNNNQALTGCLATAASQIVYYFRKDNPSATLYDTPTYGYGGAPVTKSLPKGTPLRYDLMKTSGTGSLKQDSAVAVLMYAAGTSAWLTYGDGDGTATSGQNSSMSDAIRGQFALDNECKYKASYSQQSWETLVYSNLTSGRPLLYTGASDTQGGHAVVLDGYQASTGLYHFNFGWGGQGDGYYTIDDETGMNGFHSYQSALVNITPKTQHYSARIIAPTLYEKSTGNISIMVNNNATLAQSKFYLYCSTNSSSKPSSPTAKDETTIVASGDSAMITFRYKPLTKQTVYISLYDANNNLLDKTSADILPTKSNLRLESLSADVSGDETTIDGISFKHLYNNVANVKVRLTNQDGGTICQPILRCSMYEYDAEGKTWSADSTIKIINTLQFEEGESRDTIFQFRSLKAGTLYKVHLVPFATTSTRDNITIDTPDSVVYFKAFAPSLSISKQGRHAIVTGDWNPTIFETIANDAYVTSYDMTTVNGLASQPNAANANALYYAEKSFDGATNVVVAGNCDNLVVEEGKEFLPHATLHASNARFVTKDIERGKWNVIALPFNATVPEKSQVRELTGVSNIKVNHQPTQLITAAKPFALVVSTPDFTGFTATDVDIIADSVYSAFHDSITISTTNAIADNKCMLLGEKSNQPYFLKADIGTVVSPFAAVLHNNVSNGTRVFSSTTTERAYTTLSDSLYSAYVALAENPTNSQCPLFADSIATYQKAFDTYAYDDYKAINADAKHIGELISLFLSQDLPTGINISVANDALDDSSARYYSVDGTQLAAPRRGFVIIRQGNKTRKAIVR